MPNLPVYFIIIGQTLQGQRFRPSDWAERLAGVLAPYRPSGQTGGYLSYSPYVVPRDIHGVKTVVVDERLRDIEPLAWKFVHDFASDNGLLTASNVQDIQTGVISALPAK
jgi:hypothetical protein